MKPKITNRQLVSILNLIKGLEDFQNKMLGRITNIMTMYNRSSPDNIYIRYEKEFVNAGELDYQFKIAEVIPDGSITFIDDKFADIFTRYSFLGECAVFDIASPNEYEKIN